MTYIGEIHNGVVVLKDAPRIKEGTVVRVETELTSVGFHSANGNAVLQAVSQIGNSWSESAAEMDDALEYLRQTKVDEVRMQQVGNISNLKAENWLT